MEVRPIASSLGADVMGVDLARPIDDALIAQIRGVWLERLVLRFRGQQLTPRQLIDFSARFGELERHDNYLNDLKHPEHAELLVVKTTTSAGQKITFGQQWHSDLSYTLRPSLGSCLYALKMPLSGGDTLFANMYAAYDALTPTMQRVLEDLEAVHDLTNGTSHRRATDEQRKATRVRNPPVLQPIVRVHPETGRRALFVSEWMCAHIDGMPQEECRGLLEFLFDHTTRPEHTFRQTWQVGDVLMWDNRATLHMALADYPPEAERELLRTSITGEACGRPLS